MAVLGHENVADDAEPSSARRSAREAVNPFASLRAGFTLERVGIADAGAPIGAGSDMVKTIGLIEAAKRSHQEIVPQASGN